MSLRSDRIAVVIPVKARNPKARLSSIFDEGQRKQLQIAMLEDTLGTVVKAGQISRTFVISSDEGILKFAERYGAHSILEDYDEGVNHAVSTGIRALNHYFDGYLVMPADMPLIAPSDLKTVLGLHNMGSSLVIAPSGDYGGTNMLLMTKRAAIPLHYDDDSFNNHLREANQRGLKFAVYYSTNVAFDIDSARDVHRYFKFGRRNTTMNFLERTLKLSLQRRRKKIQTRMRRPDEPPNREG